MAEKQETPEEKAVKEEQKRYAEELKNLNKELEEASSAFIEVQSLTKDLALKTTRYSRSQSDMTSMIGKLKSPILNSIANLVASNNVNKQQIVLETQRLERLRSERNLASKRSKIAQAELTHAQNNLQQAQISLKEKIEQRTKDKKIELDKQKSEIEALKRVMEVGVAQRGMAMRMNNFSEALQGMTDQQLREHMETTQSLIGKLEEQVAQVGATTDEEKEQESQIKQLTEKMQDAEAQMVKKKKTEDRLIAAEEEAAAELENLKTKKFNENVSNVAGILEAVANSLSELIQTIRKTQQAFGIAAGQATKMQAGAAIESFQSVFSAGPMVGREEVIGAQSSFQSEFGGVISSDAAGKIAQQAKELGVTTDALADARRVFMTSSMGNLDEAKSQQDQLMATFREQGLTNKDALDSIRQNSELFARNGNRFAQSFAKAAAEAKKIGVDLGKIDQIGDNIIGDFEGFLEKTAELGAMGFNIDAQRLGEISETGDTGALMTELRSQLASTGKDITQLRRSEQLSLSSAFGIPMAELQRLAAPTADSGEKKDPVEQTNTHLSTLINLFEKLGAGISVVAKILTGAIALSTATTAIMTTKMALSSGAWTGGIRGLFKGAKAATTVAEGATAATTVARGASAAAGTARGASMLGRLGKFAKFGGKALGKIALPLQLAMSAYDGFQGFNADPNASLGKKFGNAGSSILSGMTFGLLGRDASEIREAAATSPSAPTAGRPVSSSSSQQQPQQPQGVNMAELSAKLDQVVRAIASMEVKLDGQKVGQIIVANEQRVTQSAPFRGQR